MSIVAQAADALHAAHLNGTVHRDVKPGNLMVKPTGAVILVDFGVARSAAVTSVTGLNSIVGTALYMAPEQVAKGNVTPATDIYALGAVAYHCIAGHPPFDGDNALQVALMHLEDEPVPLPPEVPVGVRELITRAMAKHPDDRFASAAEFAEAALAATTPLDYRSLTGTALTSPLSPGAPTRQVALPRDLPLAPPPSPPRRTKRTGGQLAVLVAVILLGLAAAGLALALALQSDDNGNQVEPTTSQSTEETETQDPGVVPAPLQSDTAPTRKPNGHQAPAKTPAKTTKPTPSTKPTSATPSPSATTTTPPPDDPPTDDPPTPTDDPPTEGGGDNGGGQAANDGSGTGG
jgi:serine/threonine protein kinase